MPLPLSLPTIQNWSCHGCGQCCQAGMIIQVTPAERQRILQQNWTVADGVPARTRLFKPLGLGWWAGYRLGHQTNGACVFLDENKRCRIHAKFGEAAKPLPCRVYPFVFHPSGQNMAVSLRYACPSAAGNHGAPLEQQRRQIAELRDLAYPNDNGKWPAPAIWGSQQLDWPDTLRVVRRLSQMVCDEGAGLATRLVQGLWVAGMLGQATFEKVRGGRIDDLLDALARAAPLETVESAGQLPQPTRIGKAQFRLVVAQYSGRYSIAAEQWSHRLRRVFAGLRFVRGRGQTPVMQPGLAPVAFADLERPFGGDHHEIDQVLRRYYQVKMAGMAFCGPAFYGLGVVDGFQNLVLVYPIVMYIARWIALSQGRTTVNANDAERALGIVDYHHGYSTAMKRASFRQRIRLLARQNEIGRLVGWYGR